MDNQQFQRIISANDVFDHSGLNPRNLYLYLFNTLPSSVLIGQINGEKACAAFQEKFQDLITGVYQHKRYSGKKKDLGFAVTVITLSNNCVLEFGAGYCEIVHDRLRFPFVREIADLIGSFKERRKKEPRELNMIIADGGGLSLKTVEIKRTRLDLDLYYEDDLKPVDELILGRLNKKDDKGIVLLHGIPGSGKTTYLRYLIGRLKKRVLFLSPSVADSLTNPEFIELLIDNPNSILVIEDAENVIMDRKNHSGSSVSNLLNISDGLLADFLNIQVICTFNSALNMVDSALLRKGRLIAKYEFGRLNIQKARRLSRHLGFDTLIHRPMTIAEVANPKDIDHMADRVRVIGFSTLRQ